MKSCIILFLFISTAIHSFSQGKKIDSLIDAEKAFAAFSVRNGTKAAFLRFLDSNGIVFEQGKPVNGIQSWLAKENTPGVLNWQPFHADISEAGDFGYTSGPWTFQPSANDSVVARGNYTTVWHKNKNGVWKFLVDLGVSNSPEETDIRSWWELDHHGFWTKSTGTLQSMLRTEKQFIRITKKPFSRGWPRHEWYMRYNFPVPYTWVLHRNGSFPAMGGDFLVMVVQAMKGNVQYTILGSGIASSGDLGYVYGTAKINGKTDNYLRIWKKEARGWKIVVEVLRY